MKNPKRPHSSGFTLLELMIVVAIVGILSAVATGAYLDYIAQGRMAKVTAHYRSAIDYVKFHYGNAAVDASQGRSPSPAVPDTDAGWVTLLDWEASPAPGGGPAFVSGNTGDAVTGAIGIVASGTWAAGDSQVIITRPAFAQLTPESVTVLMHL